MSGPRQGEPYYNFPGPTPLEDKPNRLTIGDMDAAPGTDAWKGVIVEDPTGIPSPNIIDAASPFNLEVQIKCATAIPGGFPLPATLSVNFHANNLLTGAFAGTFAGAGPTLIPEANWPNGHTGPRVTPGDFVDWYSFTANGLTLPNGSYRIITHGHDTASGLMFFHDGTVIHVGP